MGHFIVLIISSICFLVFSPIFIRYFPPMDLFVFSYYSVKIKINQTRPISTSIYIIGPKVNRKPVNLELFLCEFGGKFWVFGIGDLPVIGTGDQTDSKNRR